MEDNQESSQLTKVDIERLKKLTNQLEAKNANSSQISVSYSMVHLGTKALMSFEKP